MLNKTATMVFLVSTLCIACPVLADDPVAVSPHIYTVLFENDEIRVLEIRYRPGERDAPHSHPAYTVLAIEGGTLRVHTDDSQSHDQTIRDNQAELLAPVARHWGENVGDTTIRAIAVEFRTKPPE